MTSDLPSAGQRVRRRVIAHGRVHGVFFRDSTRSEAQRLHVDGWVRNVDDGTVEAVFEGEPDAVDAMVAFCRRGPEKARVTRLAVDELSAPEGLAGFEIR